MKCFDPYFHNSPFTASVHILDKENWKFNHTHAPCATTENKGNYTNKFCTFLYIFDVIFLTYIIIIIIQDKNKQTD